MAQASDTRTVGENDSLELWQSSKLKEIQTWKERAGNDLDSQTPPLHPHPKPLKGESVREAQRLWLRRCGWPSCQALMTSLSFFRYYVCMGVLPTFMSAPCLPGERLGEAIRPPGTEGTDSVSHHGSTRNRMWFLWKSSQCSSPLTHLLRFLGTYL